MQSSHRNFLAASLGAVVVFAPANVARSQTVPLSATHSTELHQGDHPSDRETLDTALHIERHRSTRATNLPFGDGFLRSREPSKAGFEKNSVKSEAIAQTTADEPIDEESGERLGESDEGPASESIPDSPTPESTLDMTAPETSSPEFSTPESGITLEEFDLDDMSNSESQPSPADPLDSEDPLLESSEDVEPTPLTDSPSEVPGVEAEGDRPSEEEFDIDFDVSTDAAALIAPAPDYLNANPNPLYFPTSPDEVDIIGTQPITLDQALELARRNSRELQTSQLELERAQAALREARAARFPTLNTQADITHQDINRSSQPTSQQFNPFTGETTEVDIETDDNTTTLTGTVQIDYDLFTFGLRNANIRAAEQAVRLQELEVEVVLEELRLNITNAYYDLQEADESVRIARDTLEESLISLRDAEARERAGVGTRFDRLQAEVDAANSQQALRSSISDQRIAQRQLAELLSLPSGINILAADEVEVAGIWPLTLEESVVLAFRNRAEPAQQLAQRELDLQQRRAALASLRPQLSLFANYQLNDLLDEDDDPSSDFDSFSVGARLSWLLFDGGASRARARQEKIDSELAEVNFADTLENIRFDIEQSYYQLDSNFENIQTAATAVEVAQESLRLARLRFQAGVGIQSDVITAQADLTEAEFNLVSAILDYNRALVSMQRAVSNVEDNNLADVP